MGKAKAMMADKIFNCVPAYNLGNILRDVYAPSLNPIVPLVGFGTETLTKNNHSSPHDITPPIAFRHPFDAITVS